MATFIAATQAAAFDWVSAELSPTTEFAANLDQWSDDRLAAWIPLTADAADAPHKNTTVLIVAMDASTATRLANRAFAETAKAPDADLLPDFVAEVANLIAGRAKALTLGTRAHFRLGVPTAGTPPSGEYLVSMLAGDVGEVVVALSN